MGKTKTAFVAESSKGEKTSEEKYKEKREKQKKEEEAKIHISGLKGGQRVKIVATEELPVEEEAEKKSDLKAVNPRGKKYLEAKTKIKPGEKYKLSDAIKLVKDVSYSNFDGTMEVHLIVKKVGTSAQVTLPFSGGKAKKIEIADEKTIKKIGSGKIDFDILLATADMMPKLIPFAKVLGPKGLMPNPKNGTIIKSAKDADKFSGNSLNLKTEKDAPLIHAVFGKVSQKEEELIKNLDAILEKLGGNKIIINAYIKSTMSPSVRLQIS